MVRLTVVALVGLLTCSAELSAQAMPAGATRAWTELIVEGHVQSMECASCNRVGNAGGPAVHGLIGARIGNGFGIALSARTFQEFSFEHSQHSRQVSLLALYALPSWPNLTLSAGTGHARHDGDPTDSHRVSGAGPTISGAMAVRYSAASRVGLTLNVGVIKNVRGKSEFRPLTATFGVGLNARLW